MFNDAVINVFLILLIALLFYNMFKKQVIEEPFQKKKYRTPCHSSHNTLTKHHVKLNDFNNMFDNLETQLKEANKKGLKNTLHSIETLGNSEGLDAHVKSAKIRFSKD